MKNMSTADFCERFDACDAGFQFARKYTDMHSCYAALLAGKAGEKSLDWALWVATQPGVMSSSTLWKLAVRFVHTAQHLMSDVRSVLAVYFAERSVCGKYGQTGLMGMMDEALEASLSAKRQL